MKRERLPAAARRQAILDVALPLFAERSYRGVTTADVAHAAQVTEPVLYRHFGSKRELFLACIDELWTSMRAAIERVVAEEPPAVWLANIGGRGAPELVRGRERLANLWVQALTEATEDEAIRDHLRAHLRAVNRTIADVLRRGQAAGVFAAARDPVAEAWISMAGIFLAAAGRRLGGVLSEADFRRIGESRRTWMAAAGNVPNGG